MAVLAAIKREPKDDDNHDEGDGGVKQEEPKGGGGGGSSKPLDEERRKYIIRTRTTMLSLIIPALGPVCFVLAAPRFHVSLSSMASVYPLRRRPK